MSTADHQPDHGLGHEHEHEHEHPAQVVPFLELFYDLVFVASTMVLSNEFSHHVGWHSAGTGALMFALLWLLWFHTTVLMNVERRDDLGQRGLAFAQMFMIFVTTLAFLDSSTSDVDLVGAGYLVAVLIVAYGHHRIRDLPDPVGSWARARRNRLVLAGAVVFTGIIIPDGIDWLMYAIAIVLLVMPTTFATWRGRPVPPVDEHHLSERAALLTLIVMGEAFVKSALVISSGSITGWDVITLVVLFVILFGLFASYFDDIPKAGIRDGDLSGEMWLLAHLVLQLSIVVLAVGVSKFLQVDDVGVPAKSIVILMVAYSGIFVGLALIGAFSRRSQHVEMLVLRLGTAVVAVVGGSMAILLDAFTPGEYLLLLAALSSIHSILASRLRVLTTVVDDQGSLPGAGERNNSSIDSPEATS
jgi:low temperature requirement protein LtrA